MKRVYRYRVYSLLVPPTLWLLIFFMVPVISIAVYSFYSRGVYGEINVAFTLNNFKEAFSPVYLGALGRTLLLATSNAAISLLIGYPVAFYMSFYVHPKRKHIILLLILLPFWSSYIARIYSWLLLLSQNGPVSRLLLLLHLRHNPLDILFTPEASLVGLLYNYLPFMILAVFISLEKIDRRWLDASKDLGATGVATFRRLILPLSASGMFSGTILVLVFSVSDYIIPNILGGARYLLTSNVITNQYFSTRNVPLGAALTVVFMLTVTVIISILYRLMKKYTYA
jgi:spermidine/putrescine transport system permease protein